MKKKVFIIGAGGLIGGALYRAFSGKGYDVIGGDIEPITDEMIAIDITDKETTRKIIQQVQPDILLLTAALSHVDYCEEFPQEAEKVNVQGLQNVLAAINAVKTKVVYFSSDYVFDGREGPYAESDTPQPLCVYGAQKIQAEQILQQMAPHSLIIRTTVVYGPEHRGKNFVLGLIKRLRAGEKVRVPQDQIGTPTYSENLADVVEELVAQQKEGIYHVAGPDLLDRYSFAKEICRVFGLPEDSLVPVLTEQLGQKAKRPLHAGLKIEKVKKEFSGKFVSPLQGLEAMKRSKSI